MSKRIRDFYRDILPAGFDQVCSALPELQSWFESQLPEGFAGKASVLTLNDDEIVIAAASPPLANFLRLHQARLEAGFATHFGLQRSLKIRSLPPAATQLSKPPPTREPEEVSAETIIALERNAGWIEDDQLRDALMSLAKSLKSVDSR